MDRFKFKELIGNTNTITLLERMLKNNTFSRFSIFEGMLGTGKSTSARIAALSLTCENPVDGNPCCQCKTCKANIKAFNSNGESSCVKIINLGTFEDKIEVTSLIKDMFVLQAGNSARVYILEEAHVLKDLRGAQTAFLEEIDRMSKNTYIIMCTTRSYDVIPELSSRAIVFPFRKLSSLESKMLASREAAGAMSDKILDLVVKSSNGIPRKIINSIDFIKGNNVSLEEYQEFINDISDQFFIQLFESMEMSDMSTFISICTSIQENRQPAAVLSALKDFIMKALFTLEADVTSDLSASDKAAIHELLDVRMINKIMTLLTKYDQSLSESDLVFLLYQVRLLAQNRSMSDVYKDSPHQASIAKDAAMHERVLSEMTTQTERATTLTPVSMKTISSFSS